MTATLLTPVDRFLAAERDLSAVERFSRRQEAAPAAGRYSDLLPAAPLGPGRQYAFEVDLDACSGCKACVVACNALNGLDAGEAWRSVGTLVGTAEPYRQTVTTACHHCLDPGCLNGCPVNAYEKDPATGIVHHLDDQCIGCGYCVFTCPYEVPRYNEDRGIVRKCDMCAGRLAEGEAPACVQACPTSAISIGVVDVEEVAARADRGEFLPGAPDPAITRPTTRYRSARGVPEASGVRAADDFALAEAHAHPPLALMLVLTQAAVGTMVAGLLVPALAGAPPGDAPARVQPLVASLAGMLALVASLFHLGRPRFAFRALLGLRRSWLSREIAAFAAFAALAAAHGAATWAAPGSPMAGGLGVAAGAVGIAGVGCSVMVYAVTGRAAWSLGRSAFAFTMTTVTAGLAVSMAASLAVGSALGEPAATRALAGAGSPLAPALVAAAMVKLAGEASTLRHLRAVGLTDLRRTAILLTRELRAWARARVALGVAGGLVAPLVVAAAGAGRDPAVGTALVFSVVGVLALLGGELVERRLYFASVASPRMPGGHA